MNLTENWSEILQIASALIGIILAWFISTYYRAREKKDDLEVSKEIADAAKASAEASRARSVERLTALRIREIAGIDDITQVIEELNQELGELESRIETGTLGEGTTWTAVENLIDSYHTQALNQARTQFYFSLMAATVGFGMIIWAF